AELPEEAPNVRDSVPDSPNSFMRTLPSSSMTPDASEGGSEPPVSLSYGTEPPGRLSFPSEPPASYGEVAASARRDGGQGRDIYFRPDRYQRADLGPVGVAVEIELGDHRYSCELFDVSQNGVGFAWPHELSVQVGMSLERMTVKFDGHE